MRRADAGRQVERALTDDAARFALGLTVEQAQVTRWASATFVGARHRLVIDLDGNAGAWLAALAEADLPMRGHLAADVVVVDQRRDGMRTTATVEVLTVED